jgi:hypothetical protein
LKKLHLLFPIDEFMAEFLADFPRLWQLIVDDSKVGLFQANASIIIFLSTCHAIFIFNLGVASGCPADEAVASHLHSMEGK